MENIDYQVYRILLLMVGSILIFAGNIMAIFPGECENIQFPNSNNVSFELISNSTILSGFSWEKNGTTIKYCFSTGANIGNFSFKWTDTDGVEVVETPSSSGGGGGSGGSGDGVSYQYGGGGGGSIKKKAPDIKTNLSINSSNKNDTQKLPDTSPDIKEKSSEESSEKFKISYIISFILFLIAIILFLRILMKGSFKEQLNLKMEKNKKKLKGGTKKNAKIKRKNNAK